MIFLIPMAKSFLRLMSELKYTYMHTNLCMCMQISSGLKSGRQGQTLSWWPMAGQGAMGTNENSRSFISVWGETLLWGWLSAGYSGKLGSFLF